MADRKIVLDTETTGLDYLIKDRIIEIGAVELVDNVVTGKEFHRYLNPGVKISEEGKKIHGIRDEELLEQPVFSEIADDLLDFVGDSQIVAHNADFDRYFLNLELFFIKKPIFNKNKFVDTWRLAKQLFKGEKNSLDDLCFRFHIDTSSRQKFHGALIDARLLAEIYIQLNNILNSELSLNNIIQKQPNNPDTNYSLKKQNFPYRVFHLSPEELNAHNNFLTNIKNPVWTIKQN